ncbi:hypothetical protein CCP3SC1AL1_1390009 [Gammaproteobacteria bacterium]
MGKKITLRLEKSSRGGGVEIDLTHYGFKEQKMSAYRNYLGGDMLGKVCVKDTIKAFNRPCTDKQRIRLDKIGEELKRYYFDLTNPDTEWERQTYEQNQTMSISIY